MEICSNQEEGLYKNYKMPEQQIQPRQTAFKVLISDLINGNYVQQEGWQPNYFQVGDKQISRINLMAAVIDKQTSESLITITLDDGSGNMQAKAGRTY